MTKHSRDLSEQREPWIETLDGNPDPDAGGQHQRQEHGGRAHVLGMTGKLVRFVTDPFDHGLDSGVEQFDDNDEHHGADQQ